MTKIDIDKLLTVDGMADAAGFSRRAVYRTTKRAEADGHVVRIDAAGRRLYLPEAVKVLQKYHFNMQSDDEAAMEAKRSWGRKGGTTKARNEKLREKGLRPSTRASEKAERQKAREALLKKAAKSRKVAAAKELLELVGSPEVAALAIKLAAKLP